MDWGGCPIKFLIWGGMDLDPASWGGLELGPKIGPVKTSSCQPDTPSSLAAVAARWMGGKVSGRAGMLNFCRAGQLTGIRARMPIRARTAGQVWINLKRCPCCFARNLVLFELSLTAVRSLQSFWRSWLWHARSICIDRSLARPVLGCRPLHARAFTRIGRHNPKTRICAKCFAFAFP